MSLFDLLFRSRKGSPEHVSPTERRVQPRFKIGEPIDVFVAGRSFRGTLLDLSLSGARLATRYSRDVGDVVGVSLVVNATTQTLPLRILWARYSDGVYTMGGSFVEPAAHEHEHVRRYLEVYAAQRGTLTQRLHIA
jgi:PilZ domain